MDSMDTENFQQLFEEIKKLNQNLKNATFAIDNMTMQLNSLSPAIAVLDSILPDTDTSKKASSDPVDSALHVLFAGGDNLSRSLGYVNWEDSTHKSLKSQNLIKMHNIRDALKKVRSMPAFTEGKEVVSYNSRQTTTPAVRENGFFTFKFDLPVVDKETRFPLDAVYVDVNSPKIKVEMDFLNKLNVPPTKGVVDRFLKIVDEEKQTCASFEKLHNLKWV